MPPIIEAMTTDGSARKPLPPLDLAASNYTFTAADSGRVIHNATSVAPRTVTVPVGLPVDTEVVIYSFSSPNTVRMVVSGAEYIQGSNAAGTTWTTGAGSGTCYRARKITATVWAAMSAFGAIAQPV